MVPDAAAGSVVILTAKQQKEKPMPCASHDHSMHMCALKLQGLEDQVRSLSDNPRFECKHCGAKANSLENICAAHLGDTAPNIEGGHGTLGFNEIGKPHAVSKDEV
jgi:hypothetical protein